MLKALKETRGALKGVKAVIFETENVLAGGAFIDSQRVAHLKESRRAGSIGMGRYLSRRIAEGVTVGAKRFLEGDSQATAASYRLLKGHPCDLSFGTMVRLAEAHLMKRRAPIGSALASELHNRGYPTFGITAGGSSASQAVKEYYGMADAISNTEFYRNGRLCGFSATLGGQANLAYHVKDMLWQIHASVEECGVVASSSCYLLLSELAKVSVAAPGASPSIMGVSHVKLPSLRGGAYAQALNCRTTLGEMTALDFARHLLADPVTNVTLIGMPAVGKSELGRRLKEALGYNLVDTDEAIEKMFGGRPLQGIVDEVGHAAFMRIEEEAILRLGRMEKTIIATGGSAVYREKAMDFLSSQSWMVYLEAPLEVIRSRFKGKQDRGVVSLKGGSLESVYEERKLLYPKHADFVMDASGDDLSAKVLQVKEYLAGAKR